jgi:serine/threonine protein kinase
VTQGQFLGRGATGDVHEVTVQGWRLTHKKIYFTRRVREKEKKEMLILTKLAHVHITQLVGTYTHKKILGVLMYPVAVCDLHTFFEDVEAWSDLAPMDRPSDMGLDSLDPIHRSRLESLGYNFPTKTEQHKATIVYSKIGCLVSAVEYLHDQRIRHKDLKPANILLSRDNIWLSDFGSATDFTLLSQSATNTERGTPRYFAPE